MTPCANCGKPACDKHHILYAQHVRKWAMSNGSGDDIKRLLADERNLLCLCRQCHADHHHMHPLSRDLISAEAREFATELGLDHKLERHYVEEKRVA